MARLKKKPPMLYHNGVEVNNIETYNETGQFNSNSEADEPNLELDNTSHENDKINKSCDTESGNLHNSDTGDKNDVLVIRPIAQETLGYICALVTLAKKAGRDTKKIQSTENKVAESIRAWKEDGYLDKCFRATMKPTPKGVTGLSAEFIKWLKDVHELTSKEITQPGPPGQFEKKFEDLTKEQ